MISSSSLAVSGFRNSSVYSYAGFTVMNEENGYVETFDECERFSFVLKDGCSSVSYVSVNGNIISLSPYVMTGQRINYEVETLGSLCKRIIITGRKSDLESAEILFSCVSQNEYVYKNDDLIDFRSYSGYTGSFKDAINKCRILTVYKDSLLLSGNPDLPDIVFASCKEESGKKNPSYFGVYSYIPTGSEKIVNSAFVHVSSYIAVLKEKGGGIYIVSDSSKENSFAKNDYTVGRKEGGSAFFNCATDFYNDPVYLSERGLESITGKSLDSISVRHSSSYIDNMLTSEKNLRASSLAVWQGYLVICVDGRIYLADSRDHDNTFGYEWYYLEGIGSYVGDSLKYRHMSVYPSGDTDYSERYRILGAEDEIKDETVYSEQYEGNTVYYVMNSGEKYMVDSCGEKTGGVFSGADAVYSDGNILLFGTKDGTLSSFNNDKRGEDVEINGMLEETKDGYIHRSFYTFADHAYFSGFKTKNDDCSYPHIAKDTVKNSLTVSMNSYPGLSVHAKVRKDSLPYKDIGFVKGGDFSVFDMDFDSFTFRTSESVTSILNERERRWSSKQLMFYSDSYMKPFAVSFIAYRWSIFGGLSERDQ